MSYLQRNSICLVFFIACVALSFQDKNQYQFVRYVPSNTVEFDKGNRENISLKFQIEEGYHIQSVEVLEDFLIPTNLSATGPSQILISEPIYPESHDFRLKDVPDAMAVFSGEVHIKLPIEIHPNAAQGEYTINGVLNYQTCDSVKCYFPRKISFSQLITVR